MFDQFAETQKERKAAQWAYKWLCKHTDIPERFILQEMPNWDWGQGAKGFARYVSRAWNATKR